jgi:hypothetical protein
MRWLLCLALTLVACKPASGTPRRSSEGDGVRAKVAAEKGATRLPSLGVLRLAGELQELRASPDGQVLTVLKDAVAPKAPGVPPPMRLGDLWAAGAHSGTAVKVASQVTNMPGGWLFTADSRWIIAAAHFDPAQQVGELLVIDARSPGSPVQRVSQAVAYFVPSNDSTQLAWVENGVLSAGPLPAGPWKQLAGEVSTAEFSADGRYLYFRRRYAAAGGLYQVELATAGAQPRRLLDQVSEYTVLRSGRQVVVNARATPADREFQLHVFDADTLKGRKLTDDAFRYRVSHDGHFLAWRTRTAPGKAEQADVGELYLVQLPGGAPRKVGSAVKDFDFSPDGTQLAFRDNYVELPLGGREALPGEARVEKVGDLSLVALPDGAPKLLQRLCPNFLFSPDGAALAWTARIEHPDVTRRLLLLHKGATEPLNLKDWLYEYQFRPPGRELYFRADCMREGRSCNLLSIPVDAVKGTAPRKDVTGVYGVRFSPDGSHAMLGFAHLTDQTYDLALRALTTGEQQTVDQFVEWPAVLLGETGASVAYLVHEKSRAGLYVADGK